MCGYCVHMCVSHLRPLRRDSDIPEAMHVPPCNSGDSDDRHLAKEAPVYILNLNYNAGVMESKMTLMESLLIL